MTAVLTWKYFWEDRKQGDEQTRVCQSWIWLECCDHSLQQERRIQWIMAAFTVRQFAAEIEGECIHLNLMQIGAT